MKYAGIVVFLAFIAIAIGYFAVRSFVRPATVAVSPSPIVEEVVVVEPTADQFITTEPDLSTLRAGGSSYLAPQSDYSFLYPSDWTLDAADPAHIRIFKRGDQERPQGEISNGALIVFEAVNLDGKTLSEWIDARIQQSIADGTTQVVDPKKAVLLNSYPGFTYTLRGLGESRYLVIQKDAMSPTAVSITYLVADPQQKGYQQEVDSILLTLELLK